MIPKAILLMVGWAIAVTAEPAHPDLPGRAGAAMDKDRSDPQKQVRELLAQPLSVAAALQIATLNNPEIRAAASELDAAAAQRRQDRWFLNPMIEAAIRFDAGEQRADYAVTEPISSLLFYPLQWGLAGTKFRREQMHATEDRVSLMAAVKESYFRLQAMQGIRRLLTAVLENAEATAELAARQQRAGNTNALDEAVQEELKQNAVLDLSGLEADEAAERQTFVGLLGLEAVDTTWSLPDSLPDPPAQDPDVEAMAQAALKNQPGLRIAAEDAQLAQSALHLAQWNRFPALRAGVSVEQENDLFFVGPKVELELPLDLGANAATRAGAERDAARHRLDAVRDATLAEVRTDAARLAAARTAAVYYRDAVIPLRQRIVAETQRQYNYMLAGVYQLVQVRQNEYAARRGYLEARRDYWVERAELEKILGGSFPDSTATSHLDGGH